MIKHIKDMMTVLNIMILIFTIAMVFILWKDIPEMIPSHFTVNETIDQYDSKQTLVSIIIFQYVSYFILLFFQVLFKLYFVQEPKKCLEITFIINAIALLSNICFLYTIIHMILFVPIPFLFYLISLGIFLILLICGLYFHLAH